MWMVVGHYVGNDKFFDRMLITILFENLCWDKAMKHVLRLYFFKLYAFILLTSTLVIFIVRIEVSAKF